MAITLSIEIDFRSGSIKNQHMKIWLLLEANYPSKIIFSGDRPIIFMGFMRVHWRPLSTTCQYGTEIGCLADPLWP
jgi:hypothetical protein